MSTVLEAVEIIKVSIGAEQANNAVRAFGLTFRGRSAPR
jgi:hypothetical protein